MANAYAQFQHVISMATPPTRSFIRVWHDGPMRRTAILQSQQSGGSRVALERCIELLGYMDRGIDLSGTPECDKRS